MSISINSFKQDSKAATRSKSPTSGGRKNAIASLEIHPQAADTPIEMIRVLRAAQALDRFLEDLD